MSLHGLSAGLHSVTLMQAPAAASLAAQRISTAVQPIVVHF